MEDENQRATSKNGEVALRVYLDTTVLLALTLTRLVEVERHENSQAMMRRVRAGEILAMTSFYALHEMLIFALQNASNREVGLRLGKDALLEILKADILILPMSTRAEKILHAPMFSTLADSSDLSHAISAYVNGCQAVVSYDQHFGALPPEMAWKKPEELVASE